jgi:hypothetical protein
MNTSRRSRLASLLLLSATAGTAGAQTLVVRNNHEIPYRGPIEVSTGLPDGDYAAAGASADVRGGVARIVASLAPRSEQTLRRRGAVRSVPFAGGALEVRSANTSLALRWRGAPAGLLDVGLVVLPGAQATVDDAVGAFAPLPVAWRTGGDGVLRADVRRDGYAVALAATPYGDGFVDVRATLVRPAGQPAAAGPAYVALVRRAVTPAAREARLRFNGREQAGGDSPSTWDRDFWYVRGVDWASWRSGALSLLSVSGFTPVPTIQKSSAWVEGSHFYVWERTRQRGDTMYLVSEIAGPNPDQAKSRYMPVTPYAPLTAGDTVALRWRLAVAADPGATWAESQLRGFAGMRRASGSASAGRAELGVPYTTFGIAYFPYSTFTENFDFHRVAGLNSESFWPISPTMWAQWRRFVPRMRTDLHVIRAMGYDAVRLHHLELLRTLDRAEAFAFLDFYMREARGLGLQVMIDSEGPSEWLGAVLARYRGDVTRVELENEVLIGGIKPADPARWRELYRTAKAAAPDAQVYFTGAGNNAMFERLRALDVPFDRVGLHAYKHGPQWIEAYSSHVLGTAGYASDIGKPMSLGEFNWKDLTKLSPEERRGVFANLWEAILSPRAVPEVYHFQFQEQAAFNTTVNGTNSRHYEPVGMDRRPRPEAFTTMEMIRKYGRPDAPVRTLPIEVAEIRFAAGRAEAPFTVTNATGRAQSVALSLASFDGTTTRLLTPARVQLAAGASASGRVEVRLAAGAPVGTYHHFVEGRAGGVRSIGWGVASNAGAPTFADTTVLGDRVVYVQGPNVVREVDWSRPLAVTFGDKAAVLELEQAFQLANTLQAATGKPVRVSSEKDLPDSLAERGTVLLVGTAATSALVAGTNTPATAGKGTIALDRRGGRSYLVLTGADAKGVEAAVVELELRYWPNAKDAAVRIAGMEKGAALGNRRSGSSVDLP